MEKRDVLQTVLGGRAVRTGADVDHLGSTIGTLAKSHAWHLVVDGLDVNVDGPAGKHAVGKGDVALFAVGGDLQEATWEGFPGEESGVAVCGPVRSGEGHGDSWRGKHRICI